MRGSVSGWVVSAEGGEPLVGAVVDGSQLNSPRAAEYEWGSDETPAPVVVSRTDSVGRFAFDDLPEGDWVFRTQGVAGQIMGEARVPVFDNAVSAVAIEIVGASHPTRRGSACRGDTRERRLPGSVHGRVVRADSGEAVEDAMITVVRGAGPAPDMAPVTDAAGRFVFNGLPPGDWVLRALSPTGEIGEASVRVSSDSAAEVTIRIVPHEPWAVPEID
jgi:uncharacterized GH25 family protein